VEAAEKSNSGRDVVRSTVSAIQILAEKINGSAKIIEEFEAHSQDINNVLVVIQGIAEQTNLSALNAAIEAARAGEQGRGFAVVANEVRTLAGRTHDSTKEINMMIEKLKQGSQQADAAMKANSLQASEVVSQANQTESSLEKITQSITHVSDMSTQISTASEEQSQTLREASSNIHNIDESSQVISTQANQISQSSQDLIALANTLQSLSDQFKYEKSSL
jgi:methyl-accepting chemotaxis protein